MNEELSVVSVRINNASFIIPQFFIDKIIALKKVLLVSSTLGSRNISLLKKELEKSHIKTNEVSFYELSDNYLFDGVTFVNGSFPPGKYPEESASGRLAVRLCAANFYIYEDLSPLTVVDRRIVKDSKVIEELSLSEAGSLAFYGSVLVHPEAFYKAVRKNTKVYIASLLEDSSTLITDTPSNEAKKRKIKGFQMIEGVSILTIEGVSLQGRPQTASRMCSAVGSRGVSILMLSQGASESSMSMVVRSSDASVAASAIDEAFEKEISEGSVESVDIDSDNAIIAAVGDSAISSTKVFASFFNALSSLRIRIKLTTASPHDKSLTAVIAKKDVKKALSALYANFYLLKRTISTGLFGVGNIGKALIEQLNGQTEELKKSGIDIRIRALANSKKMLLNESGINLDNWKEEFDKKAEPLDIDRMIDFLDSDSFPHTLMIDCTASDELPHKYLSCLKRNIHIVTPNKKAGVTPYDYYQELLKTCAETGTLYLHEATVGAGLPIISTINDLINTGDKIKSISGIFSGSLAWLFASYDGSMPFSSLVLKAKELGYTEPDPRDDLSGMDVARKTVILAREIGHSATLDGMSITSLVPEQLRNVSKEEFLSRISEMDKGMKKLYDEAKSENKVLRYVGGVDENGRCYVELGKFAPPSPFALSTGSDNIISFITERYVKGGPLTIKGPGAGIEVTAGGVFADILRLCSYLGAALW